VFKNPSATVVVVLIWGFGRIAQAQYASERPISEPTIFAPGVISTGDYEVCPQLTPDGKTFYFVKSTPDANFWTIVFSRFQNGKWNAPQVAPFSGQYSDADEFITSDGKQMFFISRRPVSPDISPRLVMDDAYYAGYKVGDQDIGLKMSVGGKLIGSVKDADANVIGLVQEPS